MTLLEKGLSEMISESTEKGRQEGMEKGIRQVARNLLADGADPKLVAKTTGLSLAEVKKLAGK